MTFMSVVALVGMTMEAGGGQAAANAGDEVSPVSMLYMSVDQFAAWVGVPAAAVGGSGGSTSQAAALSAAQAAASTMKSTTPSARPAAQAPSIVPYDEGAEWNGIITEATDWDGRLIPTRWGDYTNFGYRKIALVHQMSKTDVIEAPYHGLVDKIDGNTFTYYDYVVINGNPQTALTSVATMGFSSMYGMTGDGKVVGTLTAYCDNDETQYCLPYVP